MEPFDDAGLDVERVLEAIILGGNVLHRQTGAKKRRRQVPAKQAKLVRLLATHGLVTFDQLTEAFTREWRAIERRRKGQPRLVRKRELFRNVCDLTERVNHALRAGYEERRVAARMLGLTGGRYLVLDVDRDDFAASWSSTSRPRTARPALPRSAPDKSCRGPDADEADTAQPHQEHTQDAMPEENAEATEAPPLLEDHEEILVHEDPVTGVWRFELRGHQIEVDRDAGLLRIDGHLQDSELVRSLRCVEDLHGEPIRRVIRQLELRGQLFALKS